MEVLGNGVYTLAEAAELTGMPPTTARRWFYGADQPRPSGAIFRRDYEDVEGEKAISFHNLIELNIAARLSVLGVSLQRICHVYDMLQHAWETDHPFCAKGFVTDGRQIFDLDQNNFDSTVLPFLNSLDYAPDSSRAIRWHIAEGVIVDPRYRFGKPIVEGAYITTYVLASAYQANDRDAAKVVHWYGVEESHVLAAVRFEERFAKQTLKLS